MPLRLKPEFIERIYDDPVLSGKLAKEMGINIFSLAYPLKKNSPKFTQKEILRFLSAEFGISEDDLLEDVEETEAA